MTSCLALAGLVALGAAGSASAATVTITSTADTGPGTLRQALQGVNNGDLIVLPAGTYAVTSSDLNVVDAIEIRGAGARRTVLQGNDTVRIFSIGAGLSEVTLAGLTVTGGNAVGGDGGGIRSMSNLNLLRVALTGNRADVSSTENGGGVFMSSPAVLDVRDSLIASNSGYNGGGIYGDSVVTLVNTTVTDNNAGSPNDNGDGGGMQLNDPGSVILNSTIAGNRAFDGAPSAGGGIYVGAAFTVRNSIIAGNTAFEANGMPPGSSGNPGVKNNCGSYGSPAVTDGGHNIEGDTLCALTHPTSRDGLDPLLGPLTDNGGQTDTMRLLAGSPALNKGEDCEATDQRGVPRSLGGVCDIGGYELVRCGGVVVNRVGTSAKDKLIGTGKADGILGFAGNDLLKGLAGKDALCGNAGRDRLLGGKGRDKLIGGKGRDRLRGGPGRDRLRGGPGRDVQHQ